MLVLKFLKDQKAERFEFRTTEFYSKLVLKWLDDADILMYLAHNESKPVVSERLRILKGNFVLKKMTTNSLSWLF